MKTTHDQSIRTFRRKIQALPTSEIKYHLYLLLYALHHTENEYTKSILESAIEFTHSFNNYIHDETYIRANFDMMKLHYKALLRNAGTNTMDVMLIQGLLNFFGIILVIFIGLISGIIGAILGVSRVRHMENPFKHGALDFLAGIFIGAAIGNRLPKKAFKDPLFRQVKVAIDGISKVYDRIINNQDMLLTEYYEKAIYDLQKQFHISDESLSRFKNDKNICFEINSLPAQFGFGKNLEGCIGQHSYIRIEIPEVYSEKVLQSPQYYGIEFNPPTDLSRNPIQSEKRIVSGQVILEMIALNLYLQKHHPATPIYLTTEHKTGERDCFSLLNIVLLGTNQNPLSLKRFHHSDFWVTYNVVKPVMEGLSPFPVDLNIAGMGEDNIGGLRYDV